MFQFGLTMNVPFVNYWGARAILKNYKIDLLHDRQNFDGPSNPQFEQWLNETALPWLRAKVQELYLEGDDPQMLTLSQFKYELQATTNKSYGYLYIGAVEHVQKPDQPHLNSATGVMEDVVNINGTKFVVDKGIVPVGTKGRIKVNGIGPATVVGYYNEKYGDDHKLACLMVQPHEPPQWFIEQNMRHDAEKLIKQGLLPASEKAKAYREWKKQWSLQPIPLWCNDFQPS